MTTGYIIEIRNCETGELVYLATKPAGFENYAESYALDPDGQWPVPAENLRRIQAQLEANYGWPKPNSPS